jgi:dTDP-4-amino-4,6-dideoxygalactose transaminase
VTESVSDRLLRLPFYNDLSEADQARIVEAIREFRFP